MFGKRPECPPQAPLFEDFFDCNKQFWAGIVNFNMAKHIEKFREKHSTWTERQLRNPLYWQNSVRKTLRLECEQLIKYNPEYSYTLIPEAMGLNVVETVAPFITIVSPPVDTVYKVAILGVRK